MSFEFSIPVSRDDLLNRTGVSQYVVDEVLSHREIAGTLQDVRVQFRSKGAQCVIDSFDVFFSVLCLQKDVETEIKEDAWTHIVKIGIALSNDLAKVLEEEIDPPTRKHNLNLVKMTCYLLCQYMEMLESDETKPSTSQVITKGKGKSKKKASSMSLDWPREHKSGMKTLLNLGKGKGKKKASSMSLDWPRERESGMKTLLNLVSLNIQRLWDPPIAEDEFVSLVTNCCYKMAENPEINHVVNKETRDALCHILGIMVKKYNHGLGASLKIIQLLQHFEHLVSPLAGVVNVCVAEYGHKSIVAELMREIGRMDSADLSRDTSGTRAYTQFLVEMTENNPAAVLPNISLVLCHLDGESYSMRNGVLGAIGEILVKVLSKDDLDDKMKETRDQFLDKLEDHIHDIHAFVRSKVLQIWLHIVNEKCLPLPHQENLLSLVIGRLQDKSSQVRKYAIQLITALLKNNPFASKLSAAELELNYMKEAEKLKEMMPDDESQSQNDSFQEKTEEEWKEMEKHLKPVIQEVEEDSENRQSPENLIGDDETIDGIIDKIYTQLTAGHLKDSIILMNAAREIFPDLSVNKQQQQQMETDDDNDNDDNGKGEAGSLDLLGCMKNLFMEKKHSGHLITATEGVNSEQQKDNSVVNELTKQQILVQYLKESLAFATTLQKAVPVISQLLGSKNLTDVMEAIEFFVTGFEFGLASTMIGIRRMLPLIWSKESGVKDAVVVAYKRLYLNPQGGNQRSKALAIVQNLSALTIGATLCDLTSLEGLVIELVKSGDIGQSILTLLYERFTMKIQGTTEEESRAAVQLISMAAGADMNVVKSNIDVLVKEGLGPRADTDFLLARDTCLALLKLGVAKTKKGAVGNDPYRLPEDHDMFTSIIRILVKGCTDLENRYWIPLMEQGINVIYKLAESPDKICGELIKKLTLESCQKNGGEGEKNGEQGEKEKSGETEENGMDEDGEKEKENGETEQMDKEQTNGSENEDSSKVSYASGVLARLLSLVGHVALRQLVHLDVEVFGEMKRRRAIQEQKSYEKTPASKRPNQSTKDSTSIEEEMGLAGAAAEDADSEYILKICECEVVSGNTLLSAFGPLLVAVCTDHNKYPDVDLQTSASLAIAKFMMVSSEFCDKHLQLLFTILEKSTSQTIRANTIIALGDLSFRFPNLIEPWTPHLYARLRDESPQVRNNTIQVLTHLILNDMVKVKGQISEMATCIVDHDERISSLAKLFFHELSRKGNAIYNIMPDIISRLSDPDVGVDEDHFRTIMKYLFAFIQKDKHCESLVEKLCHRYRATRVDRQWRDLSYCLSMLSYSEKSIAKLHENFMCFADKLAEDEVYSCFCTIVNKSRSFAKPEAKTLIDELEQRIESCHKKGLNEDDLAERAGSSPIKPKGKTPRKTGKTPAARKAGGKGRTRRKTAESSDEDDVIDSSKTPVPRTQRARGTKKKPVVSFSSDEDSDIELFEVDKASKFEMDKGSKKKKGQSEEKENNSEGSDSEPLTPRNLPRRKGNKRRLNSLQSPLTLNNPPV